MEFNPNSYSILVVYIELMSGDIFSILTHKIILIS